MALSGVDFDELSLEKANTPIRASIGTCEPALLDTETAQQRPDLLPDARKLDARISVPKKLKTAQKCHKL